MLQNDASQAALNAGGSTDARNDVDALPAGSPGPAAGNVISGAGTLTGATGADSGVSVTLVAIQGDGGGAELTPASAGPMEVQGRYGTLTIDAQGNYSYVRNAGTADGVQDVFTYTIAGPGGARDTATLTILLTREGETVQPNQIVQTDDGVVILPAGVELSDIRVVGRDLVITLPDGSTMTIPNGAVFVPQLVIGEVEVPPANLAALLIDAEPKPASGTPQMSSGGNFAGDVPPLDPGVPLGDLLPPTEMEFPTPDFEEVGQVLDREPEVGPNPAVQLDDETETGGIPGAVNGGDVSPDTANTSGTLNGSGGDGPLTFDLLNSGAPSGFSYVDGPGGSIIIRQGSTDVIRVDINPATGAYTVTQLAAILHPTEAAPGTENDVSFTLGYTVTDRDGDFAVGSLTINVDDDSPMVTNVQTGPGVTLDETNAAAGNVPGSFPLTATSASAAISATLAFGADLAATANSTVYALSLTGGATTLASGLQTAVGDHAITLRLVNPTTVVGEYNGSNVAFSITLNANGTFTVVQNAALEHTLDGSSAAAYDDALSLAGLVNATVTITDRDGDSASGSAPIGAGIVFRDDGPTIDVSIISEREPTLLTQDSETIGAASDTAMSSANFNAAFGLSFTGGADGAATPTLSYSLDVAGFTGAGVDSGLDQSGNDIFLYEIGGKVVGSTSATLAGVTAGNTVFDVAVSASGVVTLTQYSQIDHPAGSDPDGTDAPFDDHILSMADSLVTLTASSTVTDNDGDTASDSETIAIGANLRFADDGPDIGAALTGTQIRIDETDGVVAAGGEVDPMGGDLGTVTMTAASLYTVTNVHASADSPTSYGYALSLSSQGVLSGLQLSTTNDAIRLWNIGGTIYGSTSTTLGGVNAGNTAFTVSINASGDVTLTQYLAVEHGTPGASHDEDSASLNQGALSVSITATDSDGDTDEASVDLGSRIVFEDDGPSIDVTAGADAGVILQTDDPQTIGEATDIAMSTANFSGVFGLTSNGGSDGAAAAPALSYALDVAGYTGGPAGVDSGLNQSGNDIFLYEIGGKVVGSTSATLGGVNSGNTVFDVSVSATGVVTLTQYSQIDHPAAGDPSPTGTPFADHLVWMADSLVTLTASSTITDNDADTASDSETVNIGANLRFSDDGPDISATATTTQIRIDETDGVVAAGGEVDPMGGNLGTVTMTAASLYTVTNVHASADSPTSYGYALSLSSQGVLSGLLLSTTNAPLYLYNIGGIVYASTSTTEAGVSLLANVAFTVSINASGDVTVTQYLAVEHPTGGSSHDEDSSAMASGLIGVTVTATDFDGDTDQAGVDIGSRIVFEDDGPSINVAAGADGGVLLTTQDADTIGTSTDTAMSSANFGGVFSIASSSGGSDGAAATPALSYALDVTGFVNSGAGTAGVDSGLDQTGNSIFLYEIGGKVVGSTSATLGGVNSGNTVFDVSVSASGVVTLTQYSQIDHPAAGDPSPTGTPFADHLVWMADSLVTLTASSTITDNDADTASDSETVNIGANLRFSDDGPVAVADTNSVTEGATTSGNVLTDGTDDRFGADGQGSIQGVASGSSTATPVSGGVGVPIVTSLGTLTLLANGSYTYESHDDSVTTTQVDTFVYTIVDADGDTSTVTLSITINPVNLVADNDTVTVNEAALDTTITGSDVAAGTVTGSNPGSTAETTGGTLSVTGAVSYTLNSPSAGSFGTLVLNSNGTYTYTLTAPYDTSPDNDNGTNTEPARDVFTYTATDINGNTVQGTISVNIIDDVPIARNDEDSLTGGASVATGNVLTGADTTTGASGADTAGADAPATVTALVGSTTSDSDSAGGFDVIGTHGTLEMDANGNYTYTRTSTTPGTFQDIFTYSVTDADGDTRTATLTINISDNAPVLVAPDPVQLDDDNALSGGGNPDGPGDDAVSGTDGTLNATGGDGDKDYYFATSQTAPAGFTYNVTTGATTQTLTITQTSTGLIVATITLTTETGEYSVVQNNPVRHDSLNGVVGQDDTENNTPSFNVALLARDADTDASNIVNMVINFDDDTPVLSNVAAGAGVTLDETNAGPGGSPGSFPISLTSATAAITATQAFGADGAAAANSVVYGLTITGDSPELTTLRTAVGDHLITLVQIDGNTIQGQYNGTNVAFQIDIGTDGKVTLTQYVPLEHTTDGSSAEAHDDSLNLSGFINATITITDSDGDSTSASAPIGNLLTFKDDGPDAQLSGQSAGTVVLDESRPEGTDTADGTSPTGTDSETIDFKTAFVTGGSVDYGADGAGSVSYAFVLSAASVGSGLYALQGTDTSTTDGDGYGQGDEIMLSLSGNVISGKVGTTTYFTITLDTTTGVATFTQLLNIWHPTSGTGSFDELAAIMTAAASDIKVVQTVTDSDGDTDTAEINVGQGVFAIEDDGPQAIQPQEATVTNAAGQSDLGTPLDDDGSLAGDFGTDLPGRITFANITNGMDTAQKSNNVTIELWLSADGQTLQGRTGSTDGTDGTLIYTVQINSNGTYDFTLHDEIDNGSGVSFSDLSGGVAGNPPFKLITEPGVALELLATPINAGSVNSDSDDIAVDSQFIDIQNPDAGIRFDFGDFTYVANSGGTADDEFIIVDNETINGFKFTIDQISNGTTADVRVQAIDADTDGGVAESDVNTGDPTGDPTDPITMIKIYNTTGALVATLTADGSVPGTSAFVDFETGGTVLVTDLPSDYSIQTYTANGYSRIEITNAGDMIDIDDDDGKFSLSQLSIETTQQGDPIDLFFDIAITDADGDTLVLDDAIHVNVDPAGATTTTASTMVVSQEADSGSSFMLAASDSGGGDMQMKSMNAANTNTMLLGAIAAAGIVESAAAQGPAGEASRLTAGDELAVESVAVTSSVTAGDADEGRSLMSGETQEADSASHLPDSASRGEDVAAAAQALADSQAEDTGVPTDLLEATDTPAASQAPAAAPAEVAMPGADVLAEAFAKGADAPGQHTQELGRILADALGGGGNGPNLEAVIDAAGGKAHGAPQLLEGLATITGGDVPAWDMGAIGGFTNGNAMSMEAMLAHPDAPAQHAA